MKGKSIVMIIGGIAIGAFAYSLFSNGDIIYGIGAAVLALALLYYGIFKNRYSRQAYKDFDQSLNSNFNISGSSPVSKAKKDNE
ncbi:MAG: hypothetical protein JXQ23_04390 [Clostridia bacterium]|nr:hypothetical protein [Clostridia bacterium]